jgi:hypothetical protein
MNANTAVECSFMAPGLGPWRPDMAPYVDEHGPDLVQLGLEWHSKMLLRIEIAGTIINSYDTYTHWFDTEGPFPLDYFLGGLITGGLAFQPSGDIKAALTFDDQIGTWMARYKRFGHAMEDGVRTLHFDQKCCHIQGVCEWVACQDVVLSRLSGGTGGQNATGLYVGSAGDSSVPLVVPPEYLGNNGTLLVFMAYKIATATISFGRPADQRVIFVPTAASNLTATRSLTLGGGFWKLENEDVMMTRMDEAGAPQSTKKVFGRSVTGQQTYTLAIDPGSTPGSAGSTHILFEKRKKIEHFSGVASPLKSARQPVTSQTTGYTNIQMKFDDEESTAPCTPASADGVCTTSVCCAVCGPDPSDCTLGMQAALDSAAERTVVFSARTMWITQPLHITRNNSKLLFEKDSVVTAKKGAFTGINDALFAAYITTNLTISGYGATWRMLRSDYNNSNPASNISYTHSEGRHGLNLLGCLDTLVEGLEISETGGDGISVWKGSVVTCLGYIQTVMRLNCRARLTFACCFAAVITGRGRVYRTGWTRATKMLLR